LHDTTATETAATTIMAMAKMKLNFFMLS